MQYIDRNGNTRTRAIRHSIAARKLAERLENGDEVLALRVGNKRRQRYIIERELSRNSRTVAVLAWVKGERISYYITLELEGLERI